jgi:hypothetical protein
MQIALGLLAFEERVREFAIAGRAECGNREHLRFAALEQTGAVRARQNRDVRGQVSQVARRASVGSRAFFEDQLARVFFRQLFKSRAE